MNVLSLFDGCRMAYLAIQIAGFNINKYYCSEIDKYAIKIGDKNFPDVIKLGDVKKVNCWNVPDKIDLLIGGSPCQGFSFAGKQLNFNDSRSKLFFEYVRILKEIKPKYFLLENVKMKQDYQNVISEFLEVYPIEINSSLVSGQNRKRLYWTNINNGDIPQPNDKKIYLKDILETNLNELLLRKKSKTIMVGGRNSPKNSKQEWDSPFIKVSKKGIYKKFQNKSSCLTAGGNSGGNHSDMDLIGQKLQHIGNAIDIKGFDCTKRIYSKYGKSPTLTTMGGGNTHIKINLNDYEYRRLTPLECERLQTLPDNYTSDVSDTQRYKMIGNGFTVDVIAYILSFIKEKKQWEV